MTTLYYIETFIGSIKVKKSRDGYKISKLAKKELRKLAYAKHLRFQTLEDKYGNTWIAIFPKSENKPILLGHFKIQTLTCGLKHKPCNKKCLVKDIDYSYC